MCIRIIRRKEVILNRFEVNFMSSIQNGTKCHKLRKYKLFKCDFVYEPHLWLFIYIELVYGM